MENENLNSTIELIDSHISEYNRFKIGKTGQRLIDRFQQQYQSEGYLKIIEIGSSDSSREVDQIEEKLISHFNNHPKCDNEQIGGGEMTRTSRYYIYIVVQ